MSLNFEEDEIPWIHVKMQTPGSRLTILDLLEDGINPVYVNVFLAS